MKAGKFIALLILIVIVFFPYLLMPKNIQQIDIPSPQNKTQLNQSNNETSWSPSTNGNDLSNYGFEEGLNDFASGWTYQNQSSVKIYRVNSVYSEGNYSYYMWSNSPEINAYSEYFSIIPGEKYNVSFSVKTYFPLAEKEAGYYLELRAKNSTSEQTIQFTPSIKVTTDWTRYDYNWQIPTGRNYTQACVRITMILADNTGTGKGASSWTDDIIVKLISPKITPTSSPGTQNSAPTQTNNAVKPESTLVICNQPFLLDYQNLPSKLNFSVYFKSSNPSLDANDIVVELDEQTLTVSSIVYNESTQLYDISANLPSLEKGKYMLKLFYGSQESLNFKGVNVYQYTGDFTFIHLTDVHYNPPSIGFENQLNTTLQLIKNANPDFIIMTGDMGSSEANYQRFYAIMKSIDFDIPIFFSNGNHEKESITNLNNAVKYMGEKKTQFENEYPFTFDYGNYHFVGLDSSVLPFSSSGNISDAQFNWLKNDLKNNQDKHLIAFSHQPLYFVGKSEFGWLNNTVAQSIMNLFSDYNVIATFAGHLHRSDVSTFKGVTYYATVSGHNDTHWVGAEPFPPAGFRTIEIVNGQIVRVDITETFSYYTGEFLMKDSAFSAEG